MGRPPDIFLGKKEKREEREREEIDVDFFSLFLTLKK